MIVAKLKSAGELAVLRAKLDSRGQRMVFTNGCFDLLHVGHIRYLQAASALGDVLVVAVNGDDSVRALKGAGRPVNVELDRAEVLAALSCVDFVTVFQSMRVTDLIKIAKPHIYVKGGDYTMETLDADERAALEAVKAEIKILPLVPGKSTTATLNRASKEPGAESGEQGAGSGEKAEAVGAA